LKEDLKEGVGMLSKIGRNSGGHREEADTNAPPTTVRKRTDVKKE